ncbi:MAG: metallophosphoesterase [Carboxydocellales bacterium]
MKLLYLTDTHYRGTNPEARTDDFPAAIRAKIREIHEIAKRENVRGILHGGDLFNRPDVALSVLGEMELLIMESPAPWYVTPGSHDMVGYNTGTLPRTALGHAIQLGFVKVLGKDPLVMADGIHITAAAFDWTIDKDIAHYQPVRRQDCRVHIHIAHGMLLDHDAPFDHFLIDDIQTDADVILTGHYHPGFGVIKRRGKIFCNPGAVARQDASMAELDRIPNVALIEITNGTMDVRLIPLKSARPGTEVLSREHLEAAAERENTMADFVSLLEKTGIDRMLDIAELLQKLALVDSIPESITKNALDRLARAQERIKGAA